MSDQKQKSYNESKNRIFRQITNLLCSYLLYKNEPLNGYVEWTLRIAMLPNGGRLFMIEAVPLETIESEKQ